MKPILQAILLADHVYQDAATGKKVIAGTFDRLFFTRVQPKEVEIAGEKRQVVQGGMQAGSPYAYFSVTEVRGVLPCELRYVDLEDGKPLIQCLFEIRCDDPLRTVEGIVPLPPLPAKKAGTFALEFLCNNEPIGALRITVEERKAPENAG